ncbi:MAG: putative lipid II flippase FtsW [Thermoleophilia bacterium]|nr:putative lipid II flippase FtsW [Thermoleophilia bacterium]
MTPEGAQRDLVVSGQHRLPLAYHAVWLSGLALLVVGLVMVFSVSTAAGFFRDDGDGLIYVRQQGVAALLGLVLMVALSRIDYRRLRPLAMVALIVMLGLLVAVHVPGVGRGAKGATRWIALGGISLQPSEFAKLVVLLAAAHLLALERRRTRLFKDIFWPVALVAGPVCALILAQRDLGTALVVAIVVMGLFWVAGMRVWQWLATVGGGAMLAAAAIMSESYRVERFLAFLDPFSDPRDKGFQIIQSLLALGSGGLLGAGPGRSVQKFSYLPEAHTDMIFAVLGEELGLLGVGLVVGLFALLTISALHVARRCADPFGRLLAAGCAFLIGGQAILNVGGVTAALPLTGVPLPFISFGRNSLLVSLLALGITLSVARFGPIAVPVHRSLSEPLEPPNVAYLDRRRGHSRTRGARVGYR